METTTSTTTTPTPTATTTTPTTTDYDLNMMQTNKIIQSRRCRQSSSSTTTTATTKMRMDKTARNNHSDMNERQPKMSNFHTSLHGSLHGTAVFSSKIITATDKAQHDNNDDNDDKENERRYVILPWSQHYKLWFYVTVVAAVVTVFFETYYIAFCRAGFTPYTSATAVMEYCLVMVFVIDMIVTFDLAFYDESEGTVVYQRRAIAQHYIRGSGGGGGGGGGMFWIDVIGIFPFYLIALACGGGLVGQDTHLTQYLALVRLSKLVRLHRIKHLFRMLQSNARISFMWLTLTRNFVLVLVWSHFSACVMYFLARQNDFDETTFLGSKLGGADGVLMGLTATERYIVTLYWSTVTFAGVGYGDYSATASVYEQIWCMMYILINIIIQAWMIGSITLLIVKGDEKTGHFREALHVLHQYSTLHDMDKSLTKGLRRQLKLEFDNKEITDEHVLQHFPSSVRRKVLRKLYLPHLLQTNLMKGVRQQFVDSFLAACSVEMFSPGEDIVVRGSISSHLYLLVGGTAKIVPWDRTISKVDDITATTERDNGGPNHTSSSSSIPDSDKTGGPLFGGGGGGHNNTSSSALLQLEPGDFINDIAFFTEAQLHETVKTVTTCKTLTMSKTTYKTIADDHPGSISRILNNLLEKVKEMAEDAEASLTLSPTRSPSSSSSSRRRRQTNKKRVSYQDDGITHKNDKHGSSNTNDNDNDDDDDDPSYHTEVKRSVTAVQTQTSLAAVQELVKMHMNKQKDDHTTRFLFAASRDDVATMSLMCEHGFDPNTADYDSRTALMVASMKGHTAAVKKLLSSFRADPNVMDIHGSSALYEAVRCGHVDTMDVLLQHGAELGMTESRAASTLCNLVYESDFVMLRRLLQAGINVNAVDYDKRSAAHIAAAEGNIEAMQILAEFGADLLTPVDRWHNTIDDEANKADDAESMLECLKTLKEQQQQQ